MSLIGLDDCDAMALIGQSRVRVLSTALPRNNYLPHTCWMNRLTLPSNKGAFDSCVAYFATNFCLHCAPAKVAGNYLSFFVLQLFMYRFACNFECRHVASIPQSVPV